MKLLYTYGQKEDFVIRVTTFFGLEELLARELRDLGGRDIEPFTRGASVTGDIGFLYKLNLCLHTGLKALVPLARFSAGSDNELYSTVKSIPWENYIDNKNTLLVESVLNSDVFSHSLFVSQKVKDGIVDRFREKTGSRPDVDKFKPDFRLYVHISGTDVTILLDSTGEPLFKRGYRTDKGEAPVKEVLAAGLVKLSGWEKHRLLIDGMCGSGTIAIEAALWGAGIPPGYYRGDFTFMRWKNFDETLYERILDSAVSRISNEKIDIVANEVDQQTFKKAVTNVKNARVEDLVTCSNGSFFDLKPSRGGGVIILNPPYGERMPVSEIEKLYKEIGDKLKKDFQDFNAWIITSSPEAIKSVGLRPSRKIKVYNGAIECRYLKYELYGGSKKASKNQPEGNRA